MRKRVNKLEIHRETLGLLTNREVRKAGGGTWWSSVADSAFSCQGSCHTWCDCDLPATLCGDC